MTWPFENDTSAVIQRRNLLAMMAMALTAFMMTSIFSIGFSYAATYHMQQIRMMGTTADAALINPTREQLRQLKMSELIAYIGISQRLGSVDTSSMNDALLGLVWLDETEWQRHRLPTIANVQGAYPLAWDEIMLPTWVLEQMGIPDPQIGMTVALSYQLGEDQRPVTGHFVLSGYYQDFMSSRTNHRGSVYVSAAFQEVAGLPPTSGGSAMMTFSNDQRARSCEQLKETVAFTPGQVLEVVPIGEMKSVMMISALAVILLFIALSGYLLIYNIFYISISRDTRFFGQMKTLGTTKKQIQAIVRRQALQLALFGITAGLLLGAGFSLGIVPYALQMMYSAQADIGTTLSFSPLIFIGAAVFTFLTAMMGSMKPAKLAGAISPIAALRFTGADAGKIRIKSRKRGLRLSKMAWANIFREKKSAALVLTSLFLGLGLFLITTGLISSLSPKNFVSQWGEADFVLTYDRDTKHAPITKAMLSEIKQIDGIDQVRLTYAPAPSVTRDVAYDETVFGEYMRSLADKSGVDFSSSEKRMAYTQNFYSGIYGIDSAYIKELNQTIEHPVDLERFVSGETLLLTEMLNENGKNIFQPGQHITLLLPEGQHTFTIADAFLDADFQRGRGHVRGTAPDLFMSQEAMKALFPEYKLFRVAIQTKGNEDAAILRQLQAITRAEPEINIISRYEKEQEMREAITTTRVLGIGLSFVLLLIGVMNFINTMAVSVNARRHEFTVLESIGMTKNQIKRVLLYEGCFYWGISFALIAVFGTGIYTLLYRVFKQLVPYAVFSYPIGQMILIAGLVLAVCLLVPSGTYNAEIKSSVVERLRMTE